MKRNNMKKLLLGLSLLLFGCNAPDYWTVEVEYQNGTKDTVEVTCSYNRPFVNDDGCVASDCNGHICGIRRVIKATPNYK